MPLAAKLSAPWYKYLARKSMAGVLPETVRWRREIGVNPMWKFHERFISALAQGFPEIWNPPRLSASLSPWVADQKLDQEWQQYDPAAAYSTGIRLFNLMILGRWLTTRE